MYLTSNFQRLFFNFIPSNNFYDSVSLYEYIYMYGTNVGASMNQRQQVLFFVV